MIIADIVRSHVKSLFDLPSMAKESHLQLRTLLDGVCKHLRALKALERPVDSWDDLGISSSFQIGPQEGITTKKEWETSRSDSSVPNFKQLKDFLLQRCLVLNVIASKSINSLSKSSNTISIDDKHIFFQNSKRMVTNTATANLSCNRCKEKITFSISVNRLKGYLWTKDLKS